MPSMNIEALARQGAGTDIKHHTQSLARDRIEDFLHQHQALPGGKISDPSACRCKPFTKTRCRMFTLRLNKNELISPKIRNSVAHRLIETTSHGRGTGDRVRSRALTDVGLDPNDCLGAITRCGAAGIFVFLHLALFGRCVRGSIQRYCSHSRSYSHSQVDESGRLKL